MTASMFDHYAMAMKAGKDRFALLTAALTDELKLDVEPVVDQTGGMVLCLGIYWPDDSYVWFSDYWWNEDDFMLGLYDEYEKTDEGVYPEPPAELTALLCRSQEPPPASGADLAKAIAKWAAPFIAEHGRKHGWERR